MFEEAYHLAHDGWSRSMPKEFGVDDHYGSVVCREKSRLQCVKPGWWHEENVCPKGAPFKPGRPAKSPLRAGDGDCTDPKCDCHEFHRQAATLYMGWYSLPFWYSPYMPRTKEKFLKMASPEYLKIMSDPKYHQPQKPIPGVYTHKVQGTKGNETGLCKKKCICDDGAGSGGAENGEEACEDHKYGIKECERIGCCHYEDGQCWSSVGKNKCKMAITLEQLKQ